MYGRQASASSCEDTGASRSWKSKPTTAIASPPSLT